MRSRNKWLVITIGILAISWLVFDQGEESLETSFVENGVAPIEEKAIQYSTKPSKAEKKPQVKPQAEINVPKPVETKRTYDHPIYINGDTKFVPYVNKCLDLLASKSADDYAFVTKYIGEVVQSPTSGMNVRSIPPSFMLSNRSAYYSLTWCAAIFVHDAHHSYSYQQRVKNNQNNVRTSEQIFSEEQEANARQITAMERIGAPKREIDHMKKQDGTHGDVNKDGKYDWKDQQLRDW